MSDSKKPSTTAYIHFCKGHNTLEARQQATQRPPEQSKQVASHLAHLLAETNGPALLSTMAQLGLLGQPDKAAAESPPQQGKLGIWRSEHGASSDVWTREYPRIETMNWADEAEIPPKGKQKRILLMGESVARGYLYDPYYRPAQVLAKILNTAQPETYEVVDLAKIDQSLTELLTLAKEAEALAPDHWVIFAGNNFANFSSEMKHNRNELAQALRQGGMPAVNAKKTEWLAQKARRYVAHFAALTKRTGKPVTLILPEFNHQGFRTDTYRALPMTTQRKEWYQALDACERALAKGEHEQATSIAARMSEIDQGVSATSQTLQARSKQAAGKTEEANQHLKAARDAEIWNTATPPRCNGIVQQEIREAVAHGPDQLELVDLPQIFAAQNIEPDHYLDYCHLSEKGIRHSMAATASRILGSEGKEQTQYANAPRPEPKVEARAQFLAGLHNGFWGQESEQVKTHFSKALALPKQIVQAVLNIVGQKIPPLMTRGFEELNATADIELQYSIARLGEQLFAKTIDTLAETFASKDKGLPQQVQAARQAEHGIEHGPVDLLASWTCPSVFHPEAEWEQRHAHYKAYRPETEYLIVAGTPGRMILTAVMRAPAEGTLTIRHNGEQIAEVQVTKKWTHHRIILEPTHHKQGVNQITLSWPIQDETPEQEEALAQTIERGEPPQYQPVCGEIAKLSLAKASTEKEKEKTHG